MGAKDFFSIKAFTSGKLIGLRGSNEKSNPQHYYSREWLLYVPNHGEK